MDNVLLPQVVHSLHAHFVSVTKKTKKEKLPQFCQSKTTKRKLKIADLHKAAFPLSFSLYTFLSASSLLYFCVLTSFLHLVFFFLRFLSFVYSAILSFFFSLYIHFYLSLINSLLLLFSSLFVFSRWLTDRLTSQNFAKLTQKRKRKKKEVEHSVNSLQKTSRRSISKAKYSHQS